MLHSHGAARADLRTPFDEYRLGRFRSGLVRVGLLAKGMSEEGGEVRTLVCIPPGHPVQIWFLLLITFAA